jgi:hypothetical protein
VGVGFKNVSEKGMIYMKILKKGRVVEKRGRRKQNPCPMRLCKEL